MHAQSAGLNARGDVAVKISRSAYLAVECLVRLVGFSREEPCSGASLARQLELSVPDTESLVSQLCAAGLVEGRDGLDGGYYLTRPAHRVTVFEALQAFDEPHLPGAKVGNRHQTVADLSGTDLLWESLKGYVLLFLQGVSLADIAPDSPEALDRGPSGSGLVIPFDAPTTAKH